MRTLRLYLPVVVIVLWAIALLVFGHVAHLVRTIAWLSIAVAFKIQIDEARRQHRQAAKERRK